MERITKKNKKAKKKDKLKKNIKIVVGITCWSHLYEATESALYHLTSSPYVIGRVKSQGALVYEARNDIIKNAMEQFPDMTHLLFVDSDMTFNVDNLNYLAESGKDIISGVACKRVYPFTPCYHSDEPNHDDLIKQLQKPIKEQKPFEVNGTGMAFTLIDKKVLIKKHWNTDNLWFFPSKDKELHKAKTIPSAEWLRNKGIRFGYIHHVLLDTRQNTLSP